MIAIGLYVNNPVPVELPEGVETTISFAPILEPAGVTAVIVVALTTTTLVAATPPMVTPVAPVNPVPVMVIEVPPAIVPLVGETEVTCSH